MTEQLLKALEFGVLSEKEEKEGGKRSHSNFRLVKKGVDEEKVCFQTFLSVVKVKTVKIV